MWPHVHFYAREEHTEFLSFCSFSSDLIFYFFVQVVLEARMDNLQANPAENQEIWTPAMAERRSTPSPSIPGNRSLFLGDGAPSIGCQNLAAGSSPITGPNLLSGCSRSMMSATHEGSASAPRAALQGSCNLPAGCTKVPISIFVFQRRRAGRGSRPPTPLSGTSIPAPALPGVPGGECWCFSF